MHDIITVGITDQTIAGRNQDGGVGLFDQGRSVKCHATVKLLPGIDRHLIRRPGEVRLPLTFERDSRVCAHKRTWREARFLREPQRLDPQVNHFQRRFRHGVSIERLVEMMKTGGYRLQLRCNKRRLNRDSDLMKLAHVTYIEGGADLYLLRWDTFR